MVVTAQIAVPFHQIVAGRQGLGHAERGLAHLLRRAGPVGRPHGLVVEAHHAHVVEAELVGEVNGDFRLRLGEHLIGIGHRLVESALRARTGRRKAGEEQHRDCRMKAHGPLP